MRPRGGQEPSAGRRKVLLGIVLGYSLAIRLWAAAFDPGPGRYWDERYSLANVDAALDGKWLSPGNAFHPALAYMPQAVLLVATERIFGVGVRRAPLDFTPAAYLIVRSIQALVGMLSLLALYVLARRLMPFYGALCATILLAIVPWHLRQSTIFKPDIELVALALVALIWSAKALETGRAADYVLAGIGIGLAGSTKYHGIITALPLTFLAFLPISLPRAFTTKLQRLALTAVTVVAVISILNLPLLLHTDLVRRNFARTLRDYERKAMRQEATFLDTPAHVVSSLVSDRFHGPLVGTTALIGLSGLLSSALRGAVRKDRRASLTALCCLSFGVFYVLAYGLVTANLSEHNWLPLVPVTSVAAAFAIVTAGGAVWSRIARPAWWVRHGGPIAGGLAIVVLLALSFPYAYTLAVPPSALLVERKLAAELQPALPLRVVYQVGALPRLRLPERRRLAVMQRPSAAAPSGEVLRRADAEVYDQGARPGPPWRRVRGEVPERTIAFDGPWFRQRGPSLIVILHPWRCAAEPRSLRRANSLAGFDIPSLPEGVLVSLEASSRRRAKGPLSARVLDTTITLYPSGRVGPKKFFVSERYGREVLTGFVFFEESAAVEEVKLWTWLPPRPG